MLSTVVGATGGAIDSQKANEALGTRFPRENRAPVGRPRCIVILTELLQNADLITPLPLVEGAGDEGIEKMRKQGKAFPGQSPSP